MASDEVNEHAIKDDYSFRSPKMLLEVVFELWAVWMVVPSFQKNMYSPFSSLHFSKNSARMCLKYPSEYCVQKEDESILLAALVMHHIPTLMSCAWHFM